MCVYVICYRYILSVYLYVGRRRAARSAGASRGRAASRVEWVGHLGRRYLSKLTIYIYIYIYIYADDNKNNDNRIEYNVIE